MTEFSIASRLSFLPTTDFEDQQSCKIISHIIGFAGMSCRKTDRLPYAPLPHVLTSVSGSVALGKSLSLECHILV